MRAQIAVEEYLSALRGRHAPPTTIKAYASDLRRFLAVATEELARIDAGVVREMMRARDRHRFARRRVGGGRG
ncbi:site-specific integrase [Candidatus Nephthysia bennettiae]|uniref:Site-specific integrase n=1 Tax=Candidatus Nephthysia bennettiae TaxID=3127016 RepID=A0A934N7U8_9BACT|nr:site-specific integrase [Candidatus Dormibacteraeota bacterium]